MKFLHDHSGKPSFHRLVVAVVVPVVVLTPLAVWAHDSWSRKQLQEIPLTVTGYLGAAQAFILGWAAHGLEKETNVRLEETRQKTPTKPPAPTTQTQ